jgi:hypothetical protein
MKKLKAIAILVLFFALPLINLADGPPPPPPGQPGAPGANGNTPVGAPIDGGLGILLALGAGYGGWKIYDVRKKKLAAETDE